MEWNGFFFILADCLVPPPNNRRMEMLFEVFLGGLVFKGGPLYLPIIQT